MEDSSRGSRGWGRPGWEGHSTEPGRKQGEAAEYLKVAQLLDGLEPFKSLINF